MNKLEFLLVFNGNLNGSATVLKQYLFENCKYTNNSEIQILAI